MAAQIPPEDKSRPQEELGSELRKAVESILHDDPTEEWSEEMLDRLRQRAPRTAPRSPRRLVMWIVLVAAACLVAFVMLNSSGVDEEQRAKDGQKRPDVREPQEVQPVVDDNQPAPTLLAYRVASRQSPEALDALLDQHAARLLRPSPENGLADVMRELL